MGLTTPDLINLWGIIASSIFAFGTLCLAAIIFIYARKKDKIKGPQLSIFAFKLSGSNNTKDRAYEMGVNESLNKWVININYTAMNDGDRTTQFSFKASLTLDVKDKNGNIIVNTNKCTNVKTLQERLYQEPSFFTFYFDNLNAGMWDEATLEVTCEYFDHKKKPQSIRPIKESIKNTLEKPERIKLQLLKDENRKIIQERLKKETKGKNN